MLLKKGLFKVFLSFLKGPFLVVPILSTLKGFLSFLKAFFVKGKALLKAFLKGFLSFQGLFKRFPFFFKGVLDFCKAYFKELLCF